MWHILTDSFFAETKEDFLARFPGRVCAFDHLNPVQDDDLLLYIGLVFDPASVATQFCEIRSRLFPSSRFRHVHVVLLNCIPLCHKHESKGPLRSLEALFHGREQLATLEWIGLSGNSRGIDAVLMQCVIATFAHVVPDPFAFVFLTEEDRQHWQKTADVNGRPCLLLTSPGMPWNYRHLLLVDYTGEATQEFLERPPINNCYVSLYSPFLIHPSDYYERFAHVLYHCGLRWTPMEIPPTRDVRLLLTPLFTVPTPNTDRQLIVLASPDSETQRAIASLFDRRLFDIKIARPPSTCRLILQVFQHVETEYPNAAATIVESRGVVNGFLYTKLAMRFRDDKPVTRISNLKDNFVPSLEDSRLTAWISLPPVEIDKWGLLSDASLYYERTKQSRCWAIHRAFHQL